MTLRRCCEINTLPNRACPLSRIESFTRSRNPNRIATVAVSQCILLMWSYFSCVFSDPGRVPPGAPLSPKIDRHFRPKLHDKTSAVVSTLLGDHFSSAGNACSRLRAGWAPFADEVDMAAAEQLVRMGGGGQRLDPLQEFRRPRWCKKCQVIVSCGPCCWFHTMVHVFHQQTLRRCRI